MTFAAVGSFITQTAATFSLTPGGVGNLILLEIENPDSTVWCTAVSSSNVTWTQMGTRFTGSTNARSAVIFAGKVTSTSAQTVTLTFNGTPTNVRADGHEFSSTVGSWSLDVQGHLDGAGTNTWASLTPTAGAGELYFGFAIDAASAVAGSTSGYVYNVDGNGNGCAFNVSCPNAATAPVWGDSNQIFGVMVLVKETSAAAPSGTVQPLATVPVPRRKAARALTASVLGVLNAHGGNGSVQPRATVPVPRRATARAAWRSALGTGNASGPSGQAPGGLVIRRQPSGAVWGGFASSLTGTPGPAPAGSVQPRATVPVPRRAPARAVWAGRSTPQPHLPGSAQPRATVPLPRRYPSRALWQGQSTPQPHVPGAVQPRATVPVPRRYPARAGSWAGQSTPQPHLPGQPQPRATVPVPRRAAARALWQGQSTPQPHVPGSVQPRPVIARRATARAFTRGTVVTTVNAAPSPPVSGTVQPRPVIARRGPARAVVAGTVTRTVNAVTAPAGTVQPRPTIPVPRRSPARVIWRGNAAPGQQPQPATGGLVRRRAPARGQWRSVTGPGNAHGPAGSVQPKPVIGRRAAARAAWRGTVTPGSVKIGPQPVFRLGQPRFQWDTGLPAFQWETSSPAFRWDTGIPVTSS